MQQLSNGACGFVHRYYFDPHMWCEEDLLSELKEHGPDEQALIAALLMVEPRRLHQLVAQDGTLAHSVKETLQILFGREEEDQPFLNGLKRKLKQQGLTQSSGKGSAIRTKVIPPPEAYAACATGLDDVLAGDREDDGQKPHLDFADGRTFDIARALDNLRINTVANLGEAEGLIKRLGPDNAAKVARFILEVTEGAK